MPKGEELKGMIPWIIANVQDDEPFVLRFPRREAKRRIENVEKRKRISFMSDEKGYEKFHLRKEAWMLAALHENPSLFASALEAAMEEFDVKGWFERQNREA